MIIEQTQISKTLIIFLEVESLKTGHELENDFEEFQELVNSAGAEIVDKSYSKQSKPSISHFINKGKLEEIKNKVKQAKADLAIVNHQLSASQARNLELYLKIRVIDKTELILDIFASRATTHIGKLQVELAQLNHLSTRLIRGWTHLERQKGGIGMRGPGETEIETDRRIVRDKISLLKNKLKNIDKQMSVQRGNRGSLVRVSLVGYTNVGKSTLMNLISKSDVFAEDKLFATLDTTVRKIVVENLPFLMTDTVGFIRKLPTQLIESFKSTLNEITESDLVLHVVDISHPNYEDHIESVNIILDQIKCSEKPSLMVFNKIDKISNEELESLKFSLNGNREYISAFKKINIDSLKKKIYNEVRKIHIKRFPYNNFLYPDLD